MIFLFWYLCWLMTDTKCVCSIFYFSTEPDLVKYFKHFFLFFPGSSPDITDTFLTLFLFLSGDSQNSPDRLLSPLFLEGLSVHLDPEVNQRKERRRTQMFYVNTFDKKK